MTELQKRVLERLNALSAYPTAQALAAHLNAPEAAVQNALVGLRTRGYVRYGPHGFEHPDDPPGFAITAPGKRALAAA